MLTLVLLDGLVGDEVGVDETVAPVGRLPGHHEAIHGDVGEGDVARRRRKPLLRAHLDRARAGPIARRVECEDLTNQRC